VESGGERKVVMQLKEEEKRALPDYKKVPLYIGIIIENKEKVLSQISNAVN